MPDRTEELAEEGGPPGVPGGRRLSLLGRPMPPAEFW